MKIKISYFLAKKRCTLEKYVRVNKIKTYEQLVENLQMLNVELPRIDSKTIIEIFTQESKAKVPDARQNILVQPDHKKVKRNNTVRRTKRKSRKITKKKG